MNNIIVIAFEGKAPSKKAIEAIAGMIDGSVEVVKVIDANSIVDCVAKHVVSTIEFKQEDEPLKNAATFINAHFSNAWDMLAQVAVARRTAIRSADQEALLNAVDIIANKTSEECKQYGILPIMHNACYNVKYHILNID